MRLADFLAAIAEAGREASKVASQYSETRIRELSKVSKGGNVLKPECIYMVIDGKLVEIPRMALTKMKPITLKRLRIAFETAVDIKPIKSNGETIEATKLTPATKINMPSTNVNVTFKQGLFKKDTHVKVFAEFEMTETPEAVEIVTDRLNEVLRDKINEAK